jgi:3-hydroxy-9,10-secoandrosta-1,3,5(10)-triene-9,17-dione monooxygenase
MADAASIPQPEAGLTEATLLERAVAMRPMLYEQQEESDWRGCYSGEVHRKLLEGGFYRILNPRMFGGYELEPATYIKVVMELARGHPAAAWCFALAGSHGFLLASHFPEEVQRELFAPDGDFRSPAVAGPAGTMTQAEGGYVVDGVFPFASGSPVSNHFMGGSLIFQEDKPPRHVLFVATRDQFEVLPDWGEGRFMGMQASGSNSVKLNGAFIPENRIIDIAMMTSSDYAPEGTPGVRLHGNPMYAGVLLGWFNTEFAAILSGTALAALDEFEQAAHSKPSFSNPAMKRKQDPFVQDLFGHCRSLAQSAKALTLAAADLYLEQMVEAARAGRPITSRETFEVWGLAQQACRLAEEAVERLFHASGASSGRRGNRIQRYFRDIEMHRIHVQSQPAITSARGRVDFGLASGLFD